MSDFLTAGDIGKRTYRLSLALQNIVRARWDEGLSTGDIARRLGKPEHKIATIVSQYLDQKHARIS